MNQKLWFKFCLLYYMESQLTRIVPVFYMLLYDHHMYFVSMLYLSNGLIRELFHKTVYKLSVTSYGREIRALCNISYVRNQLEIISRSTNPIWRGFCCGSVELTHFLHHGPVPASTVFSTTRNIISVKSLRDILFLTSLRQSSLLSTDRYIKVFITFIVTKSSVQY